MHHQSSPYPSSVVFQTVFIFFLSTPSMPTHTNPSHLFSFSPYLYSRKKNTKTVKSQNDKTTTKNTLTHNNKIRVPANSQSRHQKYLSMTSKTTTSAIQKNQEKNISHLRHLRISQVRHPKTGSLTFCPPDQISQSRRLHHFPYSSPPVSRTRRFAFFGFVVLPIKE